jgi:Asp-tRNA(Asn)/Glu-tRNA(Gln) amidotransferase A subunit family amidase
LTLHTTFSSRILSDFKPCFNATVVQRLLDAGAVPVGKTVMDEFGMGSFTLNREGILSVKPRSPFSAFLCSIDF